MTSYCALNFAYCSSFYKSVYMGVKENMRRRRQKKTEAERKTKRIDKNETAKSSGICKNILAISSIINLSLLCYLFYAYKTSPISSVPVTDLYDVRKLSWAQDTNNALQNGHRLLQELQGPESVVVDEDGNWYTGLDDGRIVKITDPDEITQSVTTVVSSGRLSKNSGRSRTRSLGLRLVGQNLYFADAYQGLFVVNIVTEKLEKIVGYDDVNPAMVFTNDLTITSDERTIYFTDTSTRRTLEEAPYSLIEGECTGRLFKVDVQSRRVETLREHLCFPNGIQMDPSEKKAIVSEASRNRVVLIDLQSEEVLEIIPLPGIPDNLRPSKDGGYWISILNLHDPSFDFLMPYPAIRDILVNVVDIRHLMNLGRGVAVKLDKNFKAVKIYHDPTGKITQIVSQVTELDNGEILIGSVLAHGIAKLDGLEE